MPKLTEPTDLKQAIAVLPEYIAQYPTTLRLRRFETIRNSLSTGGDFAVWACPDDRTQEETKLFEVKSTAGGARRRHFIDASGLPLFTVSHKGIGATWFMHLPNRNPRTEPMGVFAPRYDLFQNKMHVYVRNTEQDKEEWKLEVRGQNLHLKSTTEVYLNGVLIMSARVKNPMNLDWEINVPKGLDTSLVSHCYRLYRALLILTFSRHQR